jgi:hypothetical protein
MVSMARLRSILLVILLLITSTRGHADVGPPNNRGVAVTPSPKPLVLFYSRTGTTRALALELAKQLSWKAEEVISRKNRHYLGTVTCVFDQLFDRDDDVEPVKSELSAYNLLLIASPVWIHKISSPMRTLLQKLELNGKDAFLVLTNNGNFDEEDEKRIREKITSYGLSIKGCYPVCTTDKDEVGLRRDAHKLMENITSVLNQ